MPKRRKKKITLTDDSRWLENDLSQSMQLTTTVSDLNDYRRIPLYPTLDDLANAPSSLRANRTNYSYKNCDEYLDVFFRLMREDFISVVRNSLKFLNKTNNHLHSTCSPPKMWHLQNVKISNKKSFITLFFQFDTPSRAKTINYENSQQFKNGALLLISKDEFTTFSLGVVTETYMLNRGIVGVDVIDFKKVEKWSYIDLLEPSVFYEPYRYVMAVFQDMCETNFPMKKYIVYGKKDISFPSYLRKNSVYNINGITFNILEPNEWPSADVLCLDINQYEAFKGALTKEFAMIQGPPGTGKTYIGLQIVKIIIQNMYITKQLTNPIMVVCMTNHALDQFLEGIWKITKNISRFGHGTNSDILVRFVPTMGIARKDKCSDIFIDAKQNIKTSIQQENLHLSHIREVEKNEGVLDLSYLMEVLTIEGFGSWFQNSYDLISWLFFDISYVNNIHTMDFIKTFLDTLSKNSKNDQTEKNINLFCISLKSIKLYFTQAQCQLDGLNSSLSTKDCCVSKKHDLKLTLKILKTIEDYMVKHLKLFSSDSDNDGTIRINCDCNLNSLNNKQRWMLYYYWVDLFLKQEYKIVDNLNDSTRQYTRDMKKYKSIGFLKCVQNKHVIGMTTTAAAKNRYLLKNLKCPIVIIEEAAEVLEPHIVASLSECCEHLILIGDHKQLRPQTANHDMSYQYHLDISLFERMVNNKLPSYILAEQHRMRPEIAGLIAPSIYPDLRNHPSVENRSNIRGVYSNVFCVTHSAEEEKNYELSSYINSIEAKFLVALANYLLEQGYSTKDITIMAMYSAQVNYISGLLNDLYFGLLKDIKVSSVDGYQGEENEIVLLSLVRSNSYNCIGFLKTNNRVCVALSRARTGFYIAGNLDLLARSSALWKEVKSYLKSYDQLGPKLALTCQFHLKYLGSVSNALDFKNIRTCESTCNTKLSSGHKRDRIRYTEDRAHTPLKCSYLSKKKMCIRNHEYDEMSHKESGVCGVLTKKQGDCGHNIQGKCCEIDTLKCQTRVKEKLTCGHTVEKCCSEQSTCDQICNKPNANCLFRHQCKKPCAVNCGLCTHPVPIVMVCGHVSEYICSQDQDYLHCVKCQTDV